MQGSLSCVLVALIAWVVLANAAAVTPPQQSLLDKTGYEIFWINNDVAFLLTTDGVSGAHLLYKSTNQGFVWKPVQLPNQNCYVIRIYQNPITPTQLLFVGPPESQCGFTSNDAGLTFTPTTLPPLHHISFHPTLSGYAIGTTADSQVYYSTDGYATWNKIASTTNAQWVLNADTSSQTKALSASSIYLIKENNFGYSQDFGTTMETVITSVIGLHRTSNYIYVLSSNYTLIFGQNKDNLYSAYFPFGEVVPPVFSISDDTSGATWFSTDETFYWGNVYSAGSSGGVYTQSHLHVLKRDDAYLDIHSVRGMPGVHLLNEVVNYNDFRNPILKTYITFDNGAEWKPLAPPTGAPALNLYFNYKRAGHSFYTSSHTIGLIIANGYTSATISYNDPFKLNTYLSRDAGLTWEPLYNPGSYVFQVGANGGVLVFAENNKATNHIYYSFDQGKTVTSMTLSNTPIYISTIETNSNGNSTVFVIFGVDDNGNGQIYGINFAGAYGRTCVNADYENWAPSDGAESQCWLGQLIQYSRRTRTADCLDVRGELQLSATTCPCDYEDYECDLGFERHGNSCVQTGTLPPSPPSHCVGTYHKTQGFRKVPGDQCEGGLDKGPQILNCPKGKKGSSGWIAAVVIIVVVVVLGVVAFIIYRDPALREKVMGMIRPNRGAGRYSRVGNAGRSSSLADESDFGIHDDLLEDGSEEEDAKVLHDNDISKASGRSEEAFSSRQDDSL